MQLCAITTTPLPSPPPQGGREQTAVAARAESISMASALAVEISIRDNEIDGLRTLALLVGLDVERDALPLGQRLESGPLDRCDVHEYIAAAVVRLDEAVAPLGVEEFDGTCHGHRETPFPRGCSAAGPHGAAARPDIRKRESSGLTASLTPLAPTGGGTSKPAAM